MSSSGKENLPCKKENLVDPFVRHMGINLVEVRPGYARAIMEVREYMINFHGVTHGGAVFALADAAFAAASNSHAYQAVALNININFLAVTGVGDTLTATAVEQKVGNRTGLYSLEVKNQAGEVVAFAQGLAYRKRTS